MLKDKKATKIARIVLDQTTNFGAAVTTSIAVKHYIPMHKNGLFRAAQHLGTFGLAGVAGTAASKYVVSQFDAIIAVIDNY